MTRILSLITLAFIAMTTMAQSTMNITINGTTKVCTLVSNSSTKALLEQLEKGDITYEAHDYGEFEKVGNTGYSFPQNDEDITTQPGDVILYLGSNLCLYYDENNWDFTRIGKIEGITQSEMKTFVNAGGGNVHVTLSLPKTAVNTVKANGQSKQNSLYAINGQRLSQKPEKGAYIENGIKKSCK